MFLTERLQARLRIHLHLHSIPSEDIFPRWHISRWFQTTHLDEPEDVKIFDGFKDMEEAELRNLYESLGLAMTFNDFKWIQTYFHDDENRDPSMTEIRVLDTYWSDHCRHTTFGTELTEVEFEDGFYKEPIVNAYNEYLSAREDLYKTDEKKKEKFISLMDIALMGMKKLKKDGKLTERPSRILRI